MSPSGTAPSDHIAGNKLAGEGTISSSELRKSSSRLLRSQATTPATSRKSCEASGSGVGESWSALADLAEGDSDQHRVLSSASCIIEALRVCSTHLGLARSRCVMALSRACSNESALLHDLWVIPFACPPYPQGWVLTPSSARPFRTLSAALAASILQTSRSPTRVPPRSFRR
eukprot:scaffold109010_cov34-Tisochrysis_lutea.AAC.3